jgi:type II secretory pathway pseudopilin PulG
MTTFKRKACFTLVELLTVVGIIGVLIGMVMGLMSLATCKAAEARTKSIIMQISTALENYKAKYGYYMQQSTAGAFYLDYVNVSAASTVTDGSFIQYNFCQFIDYTAMLNKNAQMATGITATTLTAASKAWLLDGYGNALVYRCPGYFNRNGFDLGSVGSDSKWGSTTTFSSTAISSQDTSSGAFRTYFGLGDDIVNFSRK